MTVAACYQCGEWKFGALTRCRNCGSTPATENDVMASLILTKETMADGELEKLVNSIRVGHRLELDEPPESELRRAAQKYLAMIRNQHQTHGRPVRPQVSDRGRETSSTVDRLNLFSTKLTRIVIASIPAIGLLIFGIWLWVIGALRVDQTDYWPLIVQKYGPPPLTVVFYTLLTVCRFEVERWAKQFRGASRVAFAFIDTSATVAWLFTWLWLAAFVYDVGWPGTFALFLVGQLAVLIWSIISRDRLSIWMGATILLWICVGLLANATTWFGYF